MLNSNYLEVLAKEQCKDIEETLLKVGVKIRNKDGTYKSTYDVLCELSEKWSDIDE